ncbi:MAG: RNA 2',3'-cyclic phosphodiesterase [Caulobacteraceae bacterium]|nr:MAG: RNA 2',3'-cyclic phosphodiesterase [Caulobacteraceae bacterium]
MLRLFTAIAIPWDIAQGLAEHQTGLNGARWRSAEQLHITLRFLGDLPENRAGDLDAELSAITAAPFDLELAGVGHFGEAADIHAIWAGVAESAGLARLRNRCESAARRAGLAADTRAYRPHVTLAYLKRPDLGAVMDWEAANNLLHSPAFPVKRFGLYSSHRTTDGSEYRLEGDYPLR